MESSIAFLAFVLLWARPRAAAPSGGVGVLIFLIFLILWVLFKALGRSSRRPPQTLGRLSAPTAKPDAPDRTGHVAVVAEVTASGHSAAAASEGLWIPPGGQVEVHGYKLDGGMIYLGSHLDQVCGQGIEPALINPSLPVTAPPAGYRGEGIPYWPSYSTVSPVARGLYLKWLAGGRQDRDVSMGIVFLFFYGLERRLLAEQSVVTDWETHALIEEIERLLRIYGDGGSFRYYARDLLQFLKVPLSQRSVGNDPVSELEDESNWGTKLRFIVGKMAVLGQPLPAKWALKWLMKSDPLYYPPPTPAQRCREEFSRLFKIRYQQRFGAGLRFEADTREVLSDYRPASASFSGRSLGRRVKLPDVKPTSQLRELAVACSEELDAYSRFLGRHPEGRSPVGALALLPTELLRERENERLATVTGWLTQALEGEEIATVAFSELEAHWPQMYEWPFRKQDALSLAQCLQKLGFGIEPDIRFGSCGPSPGENLVVFKLDPDGPGGPTPSMRAALLTLRLGAMVLAANEMNSADTEDHLVGNLSTAFHLAATERQRLGAKLHWLLVSKPATLPNKKRIDGMDLGDRVSIGRFLVGVTGARGHVSPSGVGALEKVYRLLGLESKSLYSDLQGASARPITVQERGSGGRGYAIPPPPGSEGEEAGRIDIDMTKVSAMRAQTEQVSDLLQNIFAEEDEAPAPGHVSAPTEGSILGLSAAQSGFLRLLVSKRSWSRAELEQLARAHQTLLNGAIDAINEKALDSLGEPLLEGEDIIEVNSAALKELGL